MQNDDPKRIIREGYDIASIAYETMFGDEARIQSILAFLKDRLTLGDFVLDLGCGSGIPMARALADRYALTGVDISRTQIRRARQVVPRARFVCADMTKCDFEEATFHAIVAMWSIIHIPLDEQQTLLGTIAKWLKPGGIFVATLGDEAWTGTEDNWLGVDGARMYFSHADATTYRNWLCATGLTIVREGVTSDPSGDGRHSLFFAERSS